MIHLDLFSGIGGFSYAADQVWDDVEHIFCEIDPFCQAVLNKHWKGSVIYGDIRQLIADADRSGDRTSTSGTNTNGPEADEGQKKQSFFKLGRQIDLVTGGFPCQPFSQAGKRKGTNDDRHLWPKMLRVIQLTKPTWIIAENVHGLLTIEGGLVFEQVCLDLERECYEVQPFIIPAVAVNAPHRRDRVWIVANRRRSHGQGTTHSGKTSREIQCEETSVEPKRPDTNENHVADTEHQRSQGRVQSRELTKQGRRQNTGWEQDWLEVATEFCGVDDGLPYELDGLKLSKAKHRVERLKALGNSIVPQVAIEIFKAIGER